MRNKKNLTISIDPQLLSAAKLHAKKRGVSLNEMIRQFLGESSGLTKQSHASDDLVTVLDEALNSAKKATWSRADAYDE
jgi:hypothetical protein